MSVGYIEAVEVVRQEMCRKIKLTRHRLLAGSTSNDGVRDR